MGSISTCKSFFRSTHSTWKIILNEKKIKKNFKQKSFFFEDYNEFEITFNKKDIYLIKVSSNRIIFLFTIFLSLMFIFSIKIIYLSLYPEKNLSFIKINKNPILERRDIIDRNGVILARNIHIYSAGVRPNLVKDKEKFLLKTSLIQFNLSQVERNNMYAAKRFKQIEEVINQNDSDLLIFAENEYPYLITDLDDLNLLTSHLQNHQSLFS